ncbi:hypothetical protein FGIG_02034 [Fasciola gigantica]|uniref:Uncharacterized protein n=1 Tax=Fasciola gigantica TaxID=46835 RepID=A0A504YBH0_FASGI|nr:hypothetical protein FGIG_02034 [Fasciola gigantica]
MEPNEQCTQKQDYLKLCSLAVGSFLGSHIDVVAVEGLLTRTIEYNVSLGRRTRTPIADVSKCTGRSACAQWSRKNEMDYNTAVSRWSSEQ